MVSIMVSALHEFSARTRRKRGSQTCQNAATATEAKIASISSKRSKSAKTGISTPPSSNRTANSATKSSVRGKVEAHPEGYYYIEWWQDGRKREQIKDRVEVVDRARRKALELEANRAGIETVQEIGSGKGLTVTEAVASYLKDGAAAARTQAYMAYKYCLELFANHCAKRFIQDVKREDLLAFIRKLYELIAARATPTIGR